MSRTVRRKGLKKIMMRYTKAFGHEAYWYESTEGKYGMYPAIAEASPERKYHAMRWNHFDGHRSNWIPRTFKTKVFKKFEEKKYRFKENSKVSDYRLGKDEDPTLAKPFATLKDYLW